MGPKPEGLKLSRKDKDRGYEPENCYWGVHQGGGVKKGQKITRSKSLARASR